MNNPFDYIPSKECEEAFRQLIEKINSLKESCLKDDRDFCRELENGKMLGVLIASDSSGRHHTLFAFSGQLGNSGFYKEGFVGPVFDYLQRDGYFKSKEVEISRQSKEISEYEKGPCAAVKREYEERKSTLDGKLDQTKRKLRLSKSAREDKRMNGASEDELAAMIRQSQFEKAELHRLKKRVKSELEPYETRLRHALHHLNSLKEKRRNDSETLQKWLFTNFKFLNARGESRSLNDIFSETTFKIPPSGAGECCAPKLLQAAYLQGWQPLSMAEYWYGSPKEGEVRIHGEHYPACRGKCLPILSWMLQGLNVEPPLEKDADTVVTSDPEIIFENQWFCVVNKPSGMLSVPGKGKSRSLQQWLEEKYGAESGVKVVHRLDMDTSGILIATFGTLAYKTMQFLFAMRRVKKRYIAELEGDYEKSGIPKRGCIELPLSADWLDRPRQRVDFKEGKEAITEYEFIGVSEYRSRIVFYPKTGRTHQLRIHAASPLGLGIPIAGDRLYGKNGGKGMGRLLLHAEKIEFTFPIDRKNYTFEAMLPW